MVGKGVTAIWFDENCKLLFWVQRNNTQNSNLTVQQYIPAAQVFSNNGELLGGAVKQGKVLFLNIKIINSSPVSGDAWVGIATVKPGYRPSTDNPLTVIGVNFGESLANYIDNIGGIYVVPGLKEYTTFFISGIFILP